MNASKSGINPRPKPTKADRPPKRAKILPRRKVLVMQVEDIIKEIIAWRDGQECVMKQLDGVRCGNSMMWNHLIAQGMSAWMKHDLGNVYWGCGNHNLLDKNGDKVLAEYVVMTLGSDVFHALQEEARVHNKQQRTIAEFETLLELYTQLWENHYTAADTLDGRIGQGYYGTVIYQTWAKRKDIT